jgi:MarR family transcriptional regulator, organic hydroperoxide resistance regulator
LITESLSATTRAKQLMQSYREVQRAMMQLMRIQGDPLGLTPVQMLVVRTLSETSDLSLSDLSKRIQLGCSTTSGVVKRLVESGIVDRERLDEDQRTVAIRLTDKGKELESLAYEDDESFMSKALGRFLQLSPTDVETMLELNQKLLDVLAVES